MGKEKETKKDVSPEKAEDSASHTTQSAPADALSRTPDELEQASALAEASADKKPDIVEKQPSAIKRFFKKINLYLLIFLVLVAVSIIITAVYYLNSIKQPDIPAIANQELTEEALKQLANKDASISNKSQTLTIQGNAIIDGQTLMRGNLNIAGNLQTGGSIQGPTITISGTANLGSAQINTLQVASNTAIQGSTTLRDLSVAGSSTFSGVMTASEIVASKLTLSGNGALVVPGHVSFSGPTPSRTVNNGVLGSGGSASISGSDTTGTISINTGNGPTAGCFIQITFVQKFISPPHVLVSPIGNGAGKTDYYVERNQSGFSLCASSPAPANQSFAFDYFITN